MTAGGITSVTKLVRSGAVFESFVTPPIREVEDRIVYARDKRVGLSVINQFASTRRQPGNYFGFSVLSRIMKPFIARFPSSSEKRGEVDTLSVESRPRPSSTMKGRYCRAKCRASKWRKTRGSLTFTPNRTDEWIISVDTRKPRQPRP